MKGDGTTPTVLAENRDSISTFRVQILWRALWNIVDNAALNMRYRRDSPTNSQRIVQKSVGKLQQLKFQALSREHLQYGQFAGFFE